MKALVAGATGFTGREVVRQLRDRGVEVAAHIRPGSAAAGSWAATFRDWGAEVVEAAWEPDALAELVSRAAPSHVFALIGTTRSRARSDGVAAEDIYDAIDYGLTARLIDAVVAAGTRPRFVYLSSVGADIETRSRYLRARGQAEEKLFRSGLPCTIARPSFITGPGRDQGRPFERVAAGLADGVVGLVGMLGATRVRDRYRSISNVQLAAALVEAALDPACEGVVLEGDKIHALADKALARAPG